MEISAHVFSIDSECKSGSNKCAFFSDLFMRVTKFVSRICVVSKMLYKVTLSMGAYI